MSLNGTESHPQPGDWLGSIKCGHRRRVLGPSGWTLRRGVSDAGYFSAPAVPCYLLAQILQGKLPKEEKEKKTIRNFWPNTRMTRTPGVVPHRPDGLADPDVLVGSVLYLFG